MSFREDLKSIEGLIGVRHEVLAKPNVSYLHLVSGQSSCLVCYDLIDIAQFDYRCHTLDINVIS